MVEQRPEGKVATGTALIVSFLTLVIVDALWLSWSGSAERLATILSLDSVPQLTPRVIAAIVTVYGALALGVVTLVVLPSLTKADDVVASVCHSAVGGALLGFVSYVTFDGTLAALLGDAYPLSFATVDVAWGTCLLSIVAVMTHLYMSSGRLDPLEKLGGEEDGDDSFRQ
jgi:uncharacterized membrane protein